MLQNILFVPFFLTKANFTLHFAVFLSSRMVSSPYLFIFMDLIVLNTSCLLYMSCILDLSGSFLIVRFTLNIFSKNTRQMGGHKVSCFTVGASRFGHWIRFVIFSFFHL